MSAQSSFSEVRKAIAKLSTPSSDFDLNANVETPVREALRPAGVLVPLIQRETGVHVILTKRSSLLKHHPGQIAFPGGKQDETDADITATAVREAKEEIGLTPDNVEVLGHLPDHETVTSFRMTPVIARVVAPFTPAPQPSEVSEVFEVPLAHLSAPANYSIQYRRWRGTRRNYYTVPFGPYYIWGATARILFGLAERMEA